MRSLLIGPGCLTACSLAAMVLLVGPDCNLQMPSNTAAVAADGGVVRFPGEYVDCAICRDRHPR